MITPDVINGLYELLGGVVIFGNVRRLLKDKTVQGVSPVVQSFFWSWGIWNLYFYPALGQWCSFYGGLLLTLGSTIWMGLAVYYMRRKPKPTEPPCWPWGWHEDRDVGC